MTPHKQLNLRQCHPEYQRYLDFNEKESKRVCSTYTCFLNKKYGEDELQTIDIFPSKVKNAPILIFIHGGYWRGLDKSSYSFIAEPYIQHNFTVCIVNYRLIPKVNMETVLQDIKSAMHWIIKEAATYNGDSNQIILIGHSAGGHLTLMTYLMNETLRPHIQAMCSLSGLFDLQPIKDSYLNEVLDLSENDVESFSVINKDLSVIKCPVLLSVGTKETELFIHESKSLYTKNKAIATLAYYAYEELNHYQIIHKLGDKESFFVKYILEKIKDKKLKTKTT